MLLIYSFYLGAVSFHLPFLVNIKSSFSPHILEDTVLYQQIPLPIPTKCWQMLSKNLALANLTDPYSFLLLLNLQWLLPLLVTAFWKHSPSSMFMKKFTLFFFFRFSQNASPASSGSLPREGQVVFTDLSLALPHSPASGQSHLYQWLHLEFRHFSKHAAFFRYLTGMSNLGRTEAELTWHVGGFPARNDSVHHSGHLSLLCEPRHMGAPNAGKWSSWMPRRTLSAVRASQLVSITSACKEQDMTNGFWRGYC